MSIVDLNGQQPGQAVKKKRQQHDNCGGESGNCLKGHTAAELGYDADSDTEKTDYSIVNNTSFFHSKAEDKRKKNGRGQEPSR